MGRFPSNALVNVESDGGVTISHAQCEVGQGVHTRVAQVAAYTLGCPMDVIHIADTNTEVTPNAQMTGGSMGTGQVCVHFSVLCAVFPSDALHAHTHTPPLNVRIHIQGRSIRTQTLRRNNADSVTLFSRTYVAVAACAGD